MRDPIAVVLRVENAHLRGANRVESNYRDRTIAGSIALLCIDVFSPRHLEKGKGFLRVHRRIVSRTPGNL